MTPVSPFEIHTEKYESWFTSHPHVFQAELQAVKSLLPEKPLNLEIGVGTGRFAAQLGVRYGIEPSARMGALARKRGIEVICAVSEHLPFSNASFDTVLMLTVVCFLDDVSMALKETMRILKNGGNIIIAIIDKNSSLGKKYAEHQHENVFYRHAEFWSPGHMITILQDFGFQEISTCQTIFQDLSSVSEREPVQDGFGKGGFVVIRGLKA